MGFPGNRRPDQVPLASGTTGGQHLNRFRATARNRVRGDSQAIHCIDISLRSFSSRQRGTARLPTVCPSTSSGTVPNSLQNPRRDISISFEIIPPSGGIFVDWESNLPAGRRRIVILREGGGSRSHIDSRLRGNDRKGSESN